MMILQAELLFFLAGGFLLLVFLIWYRARLRARYAMQQQQQAAAPDQVGEVDYQVTYVAGGHVVTMAQGFGAPGSAVTGGIVVGQVVGTAPTSGTTSQPASPAPKRNGEYQAVSTTAEDEVDIET